MAAAQIVFVSELHGEHCERGPFHRAAACAVAAAEAAAITINIKLATNNILSLF